MTYGNMFGGEKVKLDARYYFSGRESFTEWLKYANSFLAAQPKRDSKTDGSVVCCQLLRGLAHRHAIANQTLWENKEEVAYKPRVAAIPPRAEIQAQAEVVAVAADPADRLAVPAPVAVVVARYPCHRFQDRQQWGHRRRRLAPTDPPGSQPEDLPLRMPKTRSQRYLLPRTPGFRRRTSCSRRSCCSPSADRGRLQNYCRNCWC